MRNFPTLLSVTISAALLLIVCIQYSYTCNEQVCASMVSKCMLTQSCKCDLKNCSCCKECYNCLSYLYTECCSCVGSYLKIKKLLTHHFELVLHPLKLKLIYGNFRYVSKTKRNTKCTLEKIAR